MSSSVMGQDEKPSSKKPAPHPWLATAPGEFVRLINKGNVSIVVDDEILRQAGKSGLTKFQHRLEYKSTFDIVSTRTLDGASMVRVRCRYLKRELQVSHTIYLQSTLQPPDPWQHPLLKHEMDHVAITTDPRLLSFIEGFFSKPTEIEFEWPHARRPNNQDVAKEIDAYTQARVRDIEAFLQIQYDALDAASNQGLDELENRSQFFGELYSKDFFQRHEPALASFVTLEELARWTKIPKNKLESHYIIRL
jgi:hypothetical protein